MDNQGRPGSIIGSHPDDSKVVKVDGYFANNKPNIRTPTALNQVLRAKQKKYHSISQLPDRFVPTPETVGYDPDQPDDLDNMAYMTSSSNQIIKTSMKNRMNLMAGLAPTDRIAASGSRGNFASLAAGIAGVRGDGDSKSSRSAVR